MISEKGKNDLSIGWQRMTRQDAEMPRPLGAIADGLVYHVISRGNNRQTVFESEGDYSTVNGYRLLATLYGAARNCSVERAT